MVLKLSGSIESYYIVGIKGSFSSGGRKFMLYYEEPAEQVILLSLRIFDCLALFLCLSLYGTCMCAFIGFWCKVAVHILRFKCFDIINGFNDVIGDFVS